MSRYIQSLGYLIAGTALGFACLTIFSPNEQEIEKIKSIGGKNNAYSAAVQVAATSKEPIYRQSSAKIQEEVMKRYKENNPVPAKK